MEGVWATKTLPRAGHATKLSNRGRRALVRRWPRTWWLLWQSFRVPLWRWENLSEGQPSLQHFANQAFMVERPDGIHSVKGTWHPACQKAPKGLSDHEKQDSLVWWNQDWTPWPECQVSSLEENWHHPYGEVWCWQHHSVGMLCSVKDWETSQDREKDNRAKCREILDENLLQSTQDHRLGWMFTFQQDNNPKHTAKTTQEWLQVSESPWVASQSLDLNQIKHLWRDLKRTVQRRSPSTLTELERICTE